MASGEWFVKSILMCCTIDINNYDSTNSALTSAYSGMCCLLFVVCCVLCGVVCGVLLFGVCCVFSVVCCFLFVVCCVLFAVVCCVLFVAVEWCLLFGGCCVVFAVWCRVYRHFFEKHRFKNSDVAREGCSFLKKKNINSAREGCQFCICVTICFPIPLESGVLF